MTQRIDGGIRFDTGVLNTDYTEKPVGQSVGQQSAALMPSSTAVTEAVGDVFNLGQTVSGEIIQQMISSYATPQLRSASVFNSALRQALRNMKRRGGAHSDEASKVVQELLADADLLDMYRASLVES